MQCRDGAVQCSPGRRIALQRRLWLHPCRLERLQRIVTKLQTEAGLCEEQLNQADALLQAVSGGCSGAAVRGAVRDVMLHGTVRGAAMHGAAIAWCEATQHMVHQCMVQCMAQHCVVHCGVQYCVVQCMVHQCMVQCKVQHCVVHCGVQHCVVQCMM